MSPRPGGDVSNSSEFAVLGSGGTGERPVHVETSGVKSWVRMHPALAVIFSYLAITLVGVGYDVVFFREFRIRILDYSDPLDMVFAPFRNPVVVILALLPCLLLLSFVELRTRRKLLSGDAPGALIARWRSPALRMSAYAALMLLFAVAISLLYASQVSEFIKAGRGQHVVFARTDGAHFPEKPILIGSTTKFFFIYYPERKVTDIVPVENTALVTVDAVPRSQRLLDSAAAAAATEDSSLTP